MMEPPEKTFTETQNRHTLSRFHTVDHQTKYRLIEMICDMAWIFPEKISIVKMRLLSKNSSL